MKTSLLIMSAAVLLTGCRDKTAEADAYGNFEATEVIISSETNGRILQFDRVEGSQIGKGRGYCPY
ncbi:MAG: hypothetical protein IPJ37_07455 [Bacteroidales bacterium]|nr:hypothetical protein [Bacteroidales bacterium]